MRKLFAAVKWIIEVLFNINLLVYAKSEKSRIILMLTPQYLNLGDHAIAAAERDMLKEMFPGRPQVEINYSFYCYWPKRVRKMIQKEDLIVITGGGFMGSLWPELENAVIDILTVYKENRIVFAPETVFFKEQYSLGSRQLKRALEEHGNFLFLARELRTYEFLKKEMGLTPDVYCGLMPDAAFFFNTAGIKEKQRYGIGLCLRNDGEQSLSRNEQSKLKKMVDSWKEPVCQIKMARDHIEIPVWSRKWIVKRKMKEFASRRLIVTDRLHGMVFAAVTGTPCIAFDNISRKISGVYQWISSLSYIKLVTDMKEFEAAACFMEQQNEYVSNRNCYTDLSDRLKADYIMPAGKKED